MSKTFLVAQREYLENVRTKTFWIGILIVPILIAVSIGAQRFFSKAKDVRKYAVLDQSEGQWLSKAIRQRADAGDFLRFFEGFRFSKPGDPELVYQEFEQQLAQKKHPLASIGALLGPEDKRQLAALAARAYEGKLREDLANLPAVLTGKVDNVLPAEAKAAGISLDRYRFQLVELGDLGDGAEAKLGEKLAKGELFAYFVIGKDPLDVAAKDHKYVSNNLTDQALDNWYSALATDIVREKQIAELGLTRAQVQKLQHRLDFRGMSVTTTGEQKDVGQTERAEKWAPVAFLYFLWIAVFTAAQMLLTNTIEEKSNRLIEVLLSSISPMQLMAGKVLGIGATGLTIVGFWVLCAFFGLKYGPGFFGGQAVDLDLGKIVTNPTLLFSFVAYFLGGYLLYAAVLVGIGSVCNSLKEAQNLMQPVFICLMVPLLAMIFVTQDPNGTLARVLTYVPMFTPFLMMNRAGGPPPAWEYVASTALIIVSIVVAFWAAAKVFRVGILMTGKPPKLREILGWLKAPIGAVPETKRT